MASRPILSPFSVITNASMTAQVISAVTIIQNLSMISYDITWSGGSGATAGAFTVQVSNTYTQNAAGAVLNPGDWTSVPLSLIPTVSTSSGNGFIDIDEIGAYAMRLVYNPTGGTGVLNASINAKVA